MQTYVDHVEDLVKSFLTNSGRTETTEYLKCLNRLRYNQERASQSLEVIHFIFQFTPQEGLERREATAREILELEVIRRRDVPREAVASLQRDDVEEGEHSGAAVLDLHDLGSYWFL